MLIGLGLMPVGIGLLVWAQALGSLSVLLVATALCGTAAALGYRGSLQLINRMAPADQRAEVVSSYFLAGFCGNALPVIGIGVLSQSVGSRAADAAFGCVVATMALGALFMGWRFATGEAPPNEKGAR
jgi:MFS family permease